MTLCALLPLGQICKMSCAMGLVVLGMVSAQQILEGI